MMFQQTNQVGWRWAWRGAVILALVGIVIEAEAGESASRDAHQFAGDAERRAEQLYAALRSDRPCAPARWYSGQLQTEDGQWRTPEQIAAEALQDEALAKYRHKRAKWADSPDGQIDLARWCRRQGLTAQELFHWRQVLAERPNHPEAVARLGLKPFHGQLLSRQEIAARKADEHARRKLIDAWRPAARKWLRDLRSADVTRRVRAREEIGAIRDAEAIPALLQVFHVTGDWRRAQLFTRRVGKTHAEEIARKATLGLVEALGNMPVHAATMALVDQAVFSPWGEVRSAAIDRLKRRTLTDFVPLLVGNMIVARAESYSEGRNGLQMNGSRVFVETAEAKYFLNYHHARFTVSRQNSRTRDGLRAVSDPQEQLVTHLERQAREKTANAPLMNERISTVLAQVLPDGPDDDDPRAWWAHWRNYNEMAPPDYKPEYRQEYVASETLSRSPPYECFVEGTPVWTLTGLRPIESIVQGDQVLAIHPETGELAFKMVLATTYREPSPTIRLRLPSETIVATRGHRFWQTGEGWRMAKSLTAGQRMYGLGGSTAIEKAEVSADLETFNLVVEDFHTFLVGKSRMLVHDNSCPRPTQCVVPGWWPGRDEAE